MQFSISIHGLQSVANKLQTINQAVINETRAVIYKGGEEIATKTKVMTPVDTGNLRNSYRSEIITSTTTDFHVKVLTDVLYAPFVEFGTSRQRPQPHFTPTIINEIPIIRQNIINAIRNACK